ncbi:phosphatidylinositol phosphatase PTPRQ [Anopheles maculipalpis]|uniref:phosphatidylinositol phosphatase PTPRQ n=1 Tax=Anopheles maculipalpis TaxID=1496333 RepID=UPI00215953E9|nr:phosphatidylinositol phosphatase PTPRQ [Anopheles maculipalpis]
MLKLIVYAALLLGSGSISAQKQKVLVQDINSINNVESVLGKDQTDSFYKCRSEALNITVSRSLVNVAEWRSENNFNVSYAMVVHWVDQDRSMMNTRLELSNFNDVALPEHDHCAVSWLNVYRTDARTSDCVFGVWTPPKMEITQLQLLEIGSKRSPSYYITWEVERQQCVSEYEVLLDGTLPVHTKIASVLLQDFKLYNHRLQLNVIYRNGNIVQRFIEIFTTLPTNLTTPCVFQFSIQMREVVKSERKAKFYNPTTFKIAPVVGAVPKGTVCTQLKKSAIPIPAASSIVSKVPDAIPPNCPLRSVSNGGDLTIKPGLVGPVRNLRAITDIDRCVLLTWQPPIDGASCVKEYLITWSSESRTIDAPKTTFNVTNLEPCLSYEFTVHAIDHSNDKGVPTSITATVREIQQLSEVTELELNEVEPRSLSVKWKPPVNGTYCVESYRVSAWYTVPETGEMEEVFSNTTTDQHVTFGEVIACMVYNVQVIPISISKHDGLNEIGTLKTKERIIFSYHVKPVTPIAINARSLDLSTSLHSENNNNCLLVSVRFNCAIMKENEPDPETEIVKEYVIPNSNASFEGIVEPLVPYTMYACNVQIQNIAGWSDPTAPTSIQTLEDVPESPSVVELVGDNRAMNITWKAPTVKNGVVVRYRIHIRMVAPEYPIPNFCAPLEEFNETVDLRDEVNPDESRSWDGFDFKHTVEKLNPYTLYIVQIAAATGAGLGPYSDPVEVITLPDVSNKTESFRIDRILGPELNKTYKSSVWFSWSLPCGLHGKLTRFYGYMHGVRDHDPAIPHIIQWDVNVDDSEMINDTYSYIEDRLKPEYNYTVSLSVEVANVSELSPDVQLKFQSPAGIPTIDRTEEFFNVDVFEAPNPTNTARIVLGNMTLTSDFGSIRYMALLISERLCQNDPDPVTDFINSTKESQWPDTLDWYHVSTMPCVQQYQTTPKFWNPMTRMSRQEGKPEPIEYVVGKDICDKGQEYCNGPLKPGTEYALIVRIFSRSGFTDSEMQVFRTDSLIKVGLIVSAVIGCLLLAFIGGLVIVWRKQRLLLPAQQTGRSPTEEPSDIPVKNFPAQYDELFQSNREKVSKEFQAINYFSDFLLQETVSFQSARENERKNRYINILPFDSNRVLLDSNDDDDDDDGDGVCGCNDYINASFVEGYKYQREYIATQGPKQDTCYDFWRMVLQYEIESIVMLTQPIDHDKNKCCQYFPRFDQYIDFGDIRVKCTQELNLSLYYKRLFLVSKGNLTKAVFHYHFLDWPDHSCPASTADLIKFSKIVRAERKSYAIPLVVHCSAGVGRTGTFIALDILLQRMHQEKKINVYDTVKRLRRQRVKMVQTLDQYTFLYQCCLECVSKSNRKKPKTSNVEVIRRDDRDKQYPDVILDVEQQQVAVGNGGKPLFNIKFPKSVSVNVNSFVPTEIESDK